MSGEIASRDSDVARVDGSPSLAKLKRYFTEARDLTQQARTNALQAIDYYGRHRDQPGAFQQFARGQ